MGRKKKLTLDFFIHDVHASEDIKIQLLESRFKAEGYATFFKLLELLCQQEGVKLSLSDQKVIRLLSMKFHLRDEPHFLAIIQECVELELFDRQLWESERVIFSHGLYKRYVTRLEERKQAAVRRNRSDEAKRLQQRIDEIEAREKEILGSENPVITRDNSVITRDNPPETQNYRTTETQNLRNADVQNASVKNAGKTSTEYWAPVPDPMGDRFSQGQELPPWKSGYGRYDWNEVVVQGILSYLRTMPDGAKKTRADAVTYITKRQRPDHSEYEALVERCREILGAGPVDGATSDPTNADYDWSQDPRFEQWRSLYQQQGLGKFVKPDGINRDPQRNAFINWLYDHQEVAS